MTVNRTGTVLMLAVITSTVAAVATGGRWAVPAAAVLRYAAGSLWLAYTVLNCTDRIIAAVEHIRPALERHGDERHCEGVVEGMQRASAPPPTLRGLN